MSERKWKLPDDLPLRHSCERAIEEARKKNCDFAMITVNAVTIRRLLAHADYQADRIAELEGQVTSLQLIEKQLIQYCADHKKRIKELEAELAEYKTEPCEVKAWKPEVKYSEALE